MPLLATPGAFSTARELNFRKQQAGAEAQAKQMESHVTTINTEAKNILTYAKTIIENHIAEGGSPSDPRLLRTLEPQFSQLADSINTAKQAGLPGVVSLNSVEMGLKALLSAPMREVVRKESGKDVFEQKMQEAAGTAAGTPPETPEPRSDVAKLRADFDNGIISESEFKKGMANLFAESGPQPQSPVAKLISDFRNGFMSKPEFDAAYKKAVAQGDTEFERLLASSGMPVETQEALKRQYLVNKASGDVMSLEQNDDGSFTLYQGSSSGMTSAQAGKREQNLLDQTVAGEIFMNEADSLINAISADPRSVAAGGDFARAAKNIVADARSLLDPGYKFAKDVTPDSFSALANKSSAMRTAFLSAALKWASATGLGKGRELTDTDVQRALSALGATDSDAGNAIAKIRRSQRTVRGEVDARHRQIFNKPYDGFRNTKSFSDMSGQEIAEQLKTGELNLDTLSEEEAALALQKMDEAGL